MLKSWKTTVAGQATGIAAMLAAGIHNPDGSVNNLAVVLYLAFSIAGALAKDWNASGK